MPGFNGDEGHHSPPDFTDRRWIFEELGNWLGRADERRLLLVGGPGTGKSTLSARLVEMSDGAVLAEQYPQLGLGTISAAHFCRAPVDQTLDPLRVIEGLARQLANHYPVYREALEAQALEHGIRMTITGSVQVGTAEAGSRPSGVRIGELHLAGLSGRSAFDRLLRRPLEVLCSQTLDRPVVILIDALDEAIAYRGQENLVQVLRAATDAAEELPSQVRMLLTSRPDERATFQMAEQVLDLRAAPPNENDVRDYAYQRLAGANIEDPLRSQIAQQVATAAEDNFLYARYVIDDLLTHSERLVISGTLPLPDGLKGHYRDLLRRELGVEGKRVDSRYRPLLGALAVARGDGLTSLELAGITELRRSEADDVLHTLEQYLTPPNPHERRSLYHQSFRDFLLSDPDYHIYPEEAHEAIARFFLDEYRDNWRPGEPKGGSCDYALQYAPTHLLDALRLSRRRISRQSLVEDAQALLSSFAFLEAKTARFGLDALLPDFREAMNVLPETPSPVQWLRVLDREAHTLRSWNSDTDPAWFAQQVHNCAHRLGVTSIRAAAANRLEQLHFPFLSLRWYTSPESDSLVRVLSGHAGPVSTLAITPDGARVVSGGDETVRIWDLETGQEIRTLIGHKDLIQQVVLTPDGRQVISTSSDGDVRIWDIEDGRTVCVLAGHKDIRAVAVTPDGRQIVTAGGNSAHLWELESGTLTRTLDHQLPVFAVAITPDGQRLLTGSGDQTVRVWEMGSGRRITTLAGHTASVIFIVVTPDGCHVATGGVDGTVLVWNLEKGRRVHSLSGGIGLHNLMVSMDGLRLAAADFHSLHVWDMDSGRELAVAQWTRETGIDRNPLNELLGHTDIVLASAVTPDGARAVSGSRDRTVRVWDLTSGSEVCTFAGHTDQISSIAVAPRKPYVLSGSYDATIRVWDMRQYRKSGERHRMTGPVRALAITSDHLACVSGSDDRSVTVWDIKTGRPLQTFSGHTGPVRAVAVTPDRRQAISGSQDNTIRVWDMSSGKTLHVISEHTGWVDLLAAVPDSRKMVSGAWDATARLWDLDSGRQLQVFKAHTNFVSVLEVTRDGQHLVTGSDNALRVWDLETGREMRRLQHPSRIWAAVLTLDGHHVATACHDGALRTWDLESGQEVQRLEGHHSPIRSLAMTPDGKRFLTGADDNTVRVWDTFSGRQLGVLRGHTHSPASLAVTSDSRLALSGSTDQTVHVWDLDLGQHVASAQLDGWVNLVKAPTTSAFIAATNSGISCLALHR